MSGLQPGYLIGGSILVETVFTWPGTGFLLNKAILTRDIPLLQGTILVLAMAFVGINLVVDLIQTAVDPRIKRAWSSSVAYRSGVTTGITTTPDFAPDFTTIGAPSGRYDIA
jgi:hypothetical protein